MGGDTGIPDGDALREIVLPSLFDSFGRGVGAGECNDSLDQCGLLDLGRLGHFVGDDDLARRVGSELDGEGVDLGVGSGIEQGQDGGCEQCSRLRGEVVDVFGHAGVQHNLCAGAGAERVQGNEKGADREDAADELLNANVLGERVGIALGDDELLEVGGLSTLEGDEVGGREGGGLGDVEEI